MKISKKDRNLLILLGFVVVLALYYFFLMMPQENKIKTLEEELALKKSEKDVTLMKLSSEVGLTKNIETLEEEISASANHYFPDITQEEMLAILTSYSEGLPISFSEFAFVDNISTNPNTKKLQATVSYQTDYYTLLSYIHSLRLHDRKIVLKEVSMTNGFDTGLTGKMTYEFNAIPSVAMFTEQFDQLVSAQLNTRDVMTGPFMPYETFVVEAPTEPISETFVPAYPEYPTEDLDGDIDYEDYRPKTQIYGFEEGDYFFVGNPSTDITGMTARSKTKVSGGFSAEMNFDFASARDYSEANLVFDANPVMLSRPADFISLWVYAYEASNHGIGVVIIDSKGKEYKVRLTDSVGWTQWEEVEAEMPVEISYPCMIQRIYVEGIGFDQKIVGKYLFDQLSVSYPVE